LYKDIIQVPPVLRIDLASRTPAYEQIVRGLRALLVAGQFKPGASLPTVRDLAMDLGVHHNTVAEAYRLLADEGWLDLKRGRGARVLVRPASKAAPDARGRLTRALGELAASAVAEGLPRAAVADEIALFAERFRGEGMS
jgi:GntR family transcriptional regulator